jgi:hypothetical protein
MTVPSAKLPAQVNPQLIPAGELVTDPLPVAVTVSFRAVGTGVGLVGSSQSAASLSIAS